MSAQASLSSSRSTIISKVESPMQVVMNNTNEEVDVHRGLAKGLCMAVMMNEDLFRGKEGLVIMNGALKLAMSGVQRVQLAFNDFLWLALKIDDAEDDGEILTEYVDL